MKNDLVISGFAGRFANCDNLDELAINLYDNKDCIIDDDLRWPKGLFGLPSRCGKIKNLGHFDRDYFGISEQDANCMDPQMRILIELTFEALCDSGTNPDDLRGQNIGVFVSVDVTDTEHANYHERRISRSSLAGTHKAMFANKISFHYDLKGPSLSIVNACSSSGTAFHQAVVNIEMGVCDAAIVAGCQIALNPLYAMSLNVVKVLSPDGKSKFLSESADGYARSEACSVMYIQKSSQAKRIYAHLINIKTNCDGYRFPPFRPSHIDQAKLITQALEEANVDQDEIVYVEAHGTGTYRGDQSEVMAINKALCQGRKDRLKIGSVKTNLGHCEAASAMCSLAKVILTFENGIIPASLLVSDNYNKSVSDIITTKLDPVAENRIFTNGIVALNSYGFGGTNVVILLEGNKKLPDDKDKVVKSSLPLILPIFSRTMQGAIDLLAHFEKNIDEISVDLVRLFYEICNVSNMNYRGFLIKYSNELVYKECSKIEDRNLVFVYPGLFNHGKFIYIITGLSFFKQFKDSLKKSEEILMEIKFKLDGLYLHDNLSNYIICHVIVQIALVDLMSSFNVKAFNNLAFSLGKIACAYANSMIDQHDAITLAISMSQIFEDKPIDSITNDELQEINETISENLHLQLISTFSILQINPCNFSNFEIDHEPIIDYLTSLYFNSNKKSSKHFEKSFTEKYVLLEISMKPLFNQFKQDTQIETININKDGDFYLGVLESMGKLFQCDFPIDFKNIYAGDEYPVCRGTPSIHSLIKWDHSHDYFVSPYTNFI